jgi:hypothetical protein
MENEIITDQEIIRNTMEDEFLYGGFQMSKDREKEIKYLLYVKAELIKQTKKEIKNLHYELDTIQGTKRLEKKRR